MESILQPEYTILENVNISLDILILTNHNYGNRKFHDMIPVEYNNTKTQIHIVDMTYTEVCNNAIMSDLKCEDDEIEMLNSIYYIIRSNKIDED